MFTIPFRLYLLEIVYIKYAKKALNILVNSMIKNNITT